MPRTYLPISGNGVRNKFTILASKYNCCLHYQISRFP